MCSTANVEVVAHIADTHYCENQFLDMVETNAVAVSTTASEKSDRNNDDQPTLPTQDNAIAWLREEKEVAEGHLGEA
jgi:hypothetical protein